MEEEKKGMCRLWTCGNMDCPDQNGSVFTDTAIECEKGLRSMLGLQPVCPTCRRPSLVVVLDFNAWILANSRDYQKPKTGSQEEE